MAVAVESSVDAWQDSKGDEALAEEDTDYHWPLVASSLGYWDGERFYLRYFSLFYRWWIGNISLPSGLDKAESGNSNGVEWQQSMGRMELWYPLEGEQNISTENDVLVELSSWELKVSQGSDIVFVKGKSQGKPIKALCGEFFADVRRHLSWWELVQGPDGGKWITIHLSKLQHKAWQDVWNISPFNMHRRQSFGWNPLHLKELKSDADTLMKLEPGEPQELSKGLCAGVSPERLCSGIDQEEDQHTAHVIVHLDDETLQAVTASVPMEELFSADVRCDALEVVLRNDGLGICFATLKGHCVPELTTWQVCSTRRHNMPKEWGIKCPAFYNPALRITLTKAEPGLWGGVFADLQSPVFEPPRERMSWTERVQRALVLSPGAPLRHEVKVTRALKMCTSVECAQDSVTQRATITLHLDAALEELSHKFRVDLLTFFALKVGERMLEVCVVADAEFTMVLGELGGPVQPDKTSWEIVKEQATADNPQEHLALKISLAKGGERERWLGDVFRSMERWEVSERMREAQQAQAVVDDTGAEAEAEAE